MQTVQDLFWDQLVDFPTHVRDGILGVVLRSRSDLVGEVRSEGYLAQGADHQMLEFELFGPAKKASIDEMVHDWSKADLALLKERLSMVNWKEEGMNLGAEAEWDNFKEILDREVKACIPMKKRRKGVSHGG